MQTTLDFTQADISGEVAKAYTTKSAMQFVVVSGVAHTADNNASCAVGYNIEVAVGTGSFQQIWNAMYGAKFPTANATGDLPASDITTEATADHTVFPLPQQTYVLFQPTDTALQFRLSAINSKTKLDEPAATVLASITIAELQPDL